jgi:AcrR family transcriptional regulator
MAPADRKAAIIDSVLPLVAERGNDVTSRELAQAAGVAEGTLFRAFGDKTALVGAVAIEGLTRAGQPEETLAELTGIDPGLPLERRLELVIELGRHRVAEVVRWMSILRRMAPGAPGSHPAPPGGGGTADQHERMLAYRTSLLEQRARQRAATVEGITAVLAPDAHRLRVPVEVAISLVESAIAGAHLRIDQLQPEVPADVLADALVNGLAGPGQKKPGSSRPEDAASGKAAPGDPTPGSATPGSPTPSSPAPSPEGNSL